MTAGWIVAGALALLTFYYVIAPLLRKDAAEAERISAAVSEERDLESRREMLVAALKDVEDDRSTGKLDDDDYKQLKDELSSEAVTVMKELDALAEAREKATPVGIPSAPADPTEPRA